MSLYEKIIKGEKKLSLIGLGYVGMPIAAAFSKKVNVIGFDLNEKKIDMYKNGKDPTGEVGDEEIKNCSVNFTSNPEKLREAHFHIIAVPTPINEDKTPDLTPVISASRILGKYLMRGSIVVYESTVYPGVTEEICVPILERESGLKCGRDFKVGYSPERINPGDRVHRLETIVKIVSGMDKETLEEVAQVYSIVCHSGIYRAQSIKVAEAAKVIENSQRDINIAFMNELALIFEKMGIDTKQVIEAAGTKWNFLKFQPGLVGGHCIGVDPYYLTYKANKLGYNSQVILAGRRINDSMGKYAAERTVKMLIANDVNVKNARVGILGFTFKENCPDTRNTRVIDIVRELEEYGIEPVVCDPVADSEEAQSEYGIKLKNFDKLKNLDTVIVAVAHDEFKKLKVRDFENILCKNGIVADIKGIYEKEAFKKNGYAYWRF